MTKSKRDASRGSHPHDWVASTIVIASWSAAALQIASSSATSPVDDCTVLNATAVVEESMASANRDAGTVSTVTPR
jgi:hypothetical protein